MPIDSNAAALSSLRLALMKLFRRRVVAALVLAVLAGGAGASCRKAPDETPSRAASTATKVQVFAVKGVVRELKPDGRTLVVRHEEIPNYMAAMTMPFRVKDTNELSLIQAGDEITFRLSVTEEESWMDHVRKTGRKFASEDPGRGASSTNAPADTINLIEALSTYVFTNEFGRAVRFPEFQGKAVGFTFFFTRCPIPEYCPRLTKNFAGATEKLKAMQGAPTNWHFLSISFDPAFDTPALLHSYGRMYGYDSNRWSFLTASPDTVKEVTARFGFNAQPSNAGFDHNFLTVVVNADGFLQGMWPIGGDTTDNLVAEMLKAMAPTNAAAVQ
jgi:protein SCO1/2